MITMHYGYDSRFADSPYFVHGDYLMSAVMSSGAYGVDGWGAWSAPHGSHRMPTVEMTEVQTPILYLQAEYAEDTQHPAAGAARRHSASSAVIRRVRRSRTRSKLSRRAIRCRGGLEGRPGRVRT